MSPIKILPVEKIRQLDEYTIINEPVKSIDLMERAALQCYEWISSIAFNLSNFKVICGMGNNGGDGLAIARMLHKDGANVEVFYIRHSAEPSEDNKKNFKKAANIPGLVVTEVFEEDPSIDLSEGEMIIDALLGSGLNKPVSGFLSDIITQINASNSFIVSVDIPSGLFTDNPLPEKAVAVQADYTLTFQMPKLSFFMPENDKYVGKWEVLNINLNEDFIHQAKTSFYYTTKQDCISIYKPRKRFSHKGTYGHALLVGGSVGKIGASIMAAKACLKAGAGLVTAHIPLVGMTPMNTVVPEVMIDPDESETHVTEVTDTALYSAIAIGPGLGMHDDTARMMKLIIQNAGKPLIIDADGLNLLAENKTWLSFLPPDSILTPHFKEFERLTSKVENHFNRLEILKAFSIRFRVYVILKGAYSVIACPDGNMYFNPTGNPGMSTGGSGDVLTGILLGLRASGYSSKDACILGTWLHGKAGDIAANRNSQPAMTATDIIENIGRAYKKIINA